MKLFPMKEGKTQGLNDMSIALASLVTHIIASLILESYGTLALSLTGLISATSAQLLAVKLWDGHKETIRAT